MRRTGGHTAHTIGMCLGAAGGAPTVWRRTRGEGSCGTLAAPHAAARQRTSAAVRNVIALGLQHLLHASRFDSAFLRTCTLATSTHNAQATPSGLRFCRHATNAAAPPYAMPEGLQRAAPPPAQLLEVALESAAAHSRAALQYSAAASRADGNQNRELALDMQDWAMQVC
jgi:hypothetical protein